MAVLAGFGSVRASGGDHTLKLQALSEIKRGGYRTPCERAAYD